MLGILGTIRREYIPIVETINVPTNIKVVTVELPIIPSNINLEYEE